MGGEVVILANSLISHFQWGLRHSALVALVALIAPQTDSDLLQIVSKFGHQVTSLPKFQGCPFALPHCTMTQAPLKVGN